MISFSALQSVAVEHKQPMLCESIRHQRSDLVLALLSHFRDSEVKVKEVLRVVLDKQRYGFFNDQFNEPSRAGRRQSSSASVTGKLTIENVFLVTANFI